MRGNTFGKLFSITSFGESHGPAMGVVIDGMPSNIAVSLDDLQKELDRRSPGRAPTVSARLEPDRAEVLSGVYHGKTLGSPIAVVVRNVDARSEDYNPSTYRMGHADRTTELKFGIRDHRGGGRASARETIARVIGGYFAGLVLKKFNIHIEARITEIAGLQHDWEELLVRYREQGESVGGKVSVLISHCPAGLGEPAFDKLKSDLARAMLSIGGCVGFSYGLGERCATTLGTELTKDLSHFGGIEGGISNGELIRLDLVFRAPSTLGERAKQGRHDPCVVPRAIPVIEGMAKMVIVDHFLRQKAYDI